MQTKNFFGVELPAELKRELKKAADQRMQSQGSIVRIALLEYLKENDPRDSKGEDG